MTSRSPTDETTLKLATDFPTADHGQWLKLVDKVLAGAAFEQKLVSRTYDGLAIKPLYTRADWPGETDASGFPGGAPFTRGAGVLGVPGSWGDGWDIRQVHDAADPSAANAAIREDLERGVTSIVLKIDPAGRDGAHVETTADLAATLDGVYLDLAPLVLETHGPTLPPAALLMQLLAQRGGQSTFAGNFGLDDIGGFALGGRLAAASLSSAMEAMADGAFRIAKTYPKARAFTVRGTIYHAAGATDAQELGIALATAVAYLRAAAQRLPIDEAVGQIAFTLAVDADFFLSIAKIRAMRRLWGRVAEVCGAGVRTAAITACTASRMMTQRDPWVNVLRTTVACFAAGIAGADAISVAPFDQARGPASAQARRIARNTQIVLKEEATLAKVVDPAGGAWLFERLTDELAEKAWAFFQEIEHKGGIGEALISGFIAESIARAQAERARNIARRKDAITGVSAFPNIAEPALAVSDKKVSAAAATRAAKAVTLPAAGDGVLTAALEKAAADGASVQTMTAALARGGVVETKALAPLRLAQGFEHLRDASDAFLAKFGERPRIFLANMGMIAEFTARATYAKNFFETGGIAAVAGAGGNDTAAIAADFSQSGASFVVICATDTLYQERAEPLARALKQAGAALLYLAGRPGELEAKLRAAGVDDFIFMGCDVQATLERAYAVIDKHTPNRPRM